MARHTLPATAIPSRRKFLRQGLAVGAGTLGAGLLAGAAPVFAAESTGAPTAGDVDLLRFAAAIEIIESDLWAQYNEFGGIQDDEVPGGRGNALYTAAILQLDTDMSQYIHDNTDDELRRDFTSGSSSRAAPACTPSSPSKPTMSSPCVSCSASGRARPCTSRRGPTKPATRPR